MINIYICEDNQEQLEKVKKAVLDTVMIEDMDMKLALATKNPHAILDDIDEKGGTGIYFLDVDLKTDINGIQLAEKIRQRDPSGFVIFITTHAELSYLTFKYKVEALDYIIKDDFDMVSKRVRECLMYAFKSFASSGDDRGEVFYIHTKDKVVLIEYSKIICFETSPTIHKITLYAENRQIEFYSNMKDIEDKLDSRFIRCHRSYIVNQDYIKEVDKKKRMIYLKNGQSCLISVRGLKYIK
ncbi:LytR/AlgR family response regulator transcription factor [Anaeromicropila herbilytica]|uniref:Stage 0 sporulation protein A homolog n=1 Tax=Anaeromicropila herbilytica TaxID=2785025 RepID=A0A7R7ICI0_9FIRM|nr:LytTR family DNA-binding domain-containing protein [Anaeromicropila herbilytica]BCN29886.1 DNA-binding response regulator [Anaeromicropila herbilytica]